MPSSHPPSDDGRLTPSTTGTVTRVLACPRAAAPAAVKPGFAPSLAHREGALLLRKLLLPTGASPARRSGAAAERAAGCREVRQAAAQLPSEIRSLTGSEERSLTC